MRERAFLRPNGNVTCRRLFRFHPTIAGTLDLLGVSNEKCRSLGTRRADFCTHSAERFRRFVNVFAAP